MSAQPMDQTTGTVGENSKFYEEGLIAGVIGAATVALWFLLLDTFFGRPLFTPNILGTALFHGVKGLTSPESLPIMPQMVFMFSWIHLLVFCVIGVAASFLIRLAERDPNYGFGLLLLAVFFAFGFISVSLVFAEVVLHALTVPGILIGNVLAAAAMGAYFRRRHPDLTFYP